MMLTWWKETRFICRFFGIWIIGGLGLLAMIYPISLVIAWILQAAQALGVWPYA